MKRKLRSIIGSKRRALFFGVVIFAWINLSSAQNNGLNVFQDQDQDGLTDQEETSYGTDPKNNDTDGDGYMDGKEVQSGYNPLKPAPGDKLIAEEQPAVAAAQNQTAQAGTIVAGENLTDTFIENIKESKGEEFGLLQELSANPDALQDEDKVEELQNISLTQEELDDILKQSLEEASIEDEMELLDESEIKVLPKPEGTEEEIKAEEKQQIEKYFIGLGFILLQNAPFEVNNESEIETKTVSFIGELSNIIQAGDMSQLTNLQERAGKSYDEIKDLEVPAVLKDIHLTGLSIFKYLAAQDPSTLTNQDDPMTLVIQIGKVEAAVSQLQALGMKVETILNEYGITAFNTSNISEMTTKEAVSDEGTTDIEESPAQ